MARLLPQRSTEILLTAKSTPPRLVVLAGSTDKLDEWHAKSKDLGISTSELVRRLLDGVRIVSSEPDRRLDLARAELLATRHQLAKIGNNLNQLVRAVHSRQVHAVDEQHLATIDDLVSAVAEAKEAVDRLDARMTSRDDRE